MNSKKLDRYSSFLSGRRGMGRGEQGAKRLKKRNKRKKEISIINEFKKVVEVQLLTLGKAGDGPKKKKKGLREQREKGAFGWYEIFSAKPLYSLRLCGEKKA